MITRERVTEILRKVGTKEIEVESAGLPYCGQTVIATPDRSIWICFFIDCDELDYVDEIEVDGAIADFDDLWDEESFTGPIDLLSDEEKQLLIDAFGNPSPGAGGYWARPDAGGYWEEYWAHKQPQIIEVGHLSTPQGGANA
jgi:hypothetical protein